MFVIERIAEIQELEVLCEGTTGMPIIEDDIFALFEEQIGENAVGYNFVEFDERSTDFVIKGDGSTKIYAKYTLKQFDVEFGYMLKGTNSNGEGVASATLTHTEIGQDDPVSEDMENNTTVEVSYLSEMTIKILPAKGYTFNKIIITGIDNNGQDVYLEYNLLDENGFVYSAEPREPNPEDPQDEDFEGSTIFTMFAYDIKITVDVSPKTYQLIYHRNLQGHEENEISVDVEFNSQVALDSEVANTFAEEGYVLLGWAVGNSAATEIDAELDEVFDAKEWQEGGKFAGYEDGIHLYGIWRTIVYSVAYDPNNGEGTLENSEGLHFDRPEQLRVLSTTPEITREGYIFMGWALTEQGEIIEVETIEQMKEFGPGIYKMNGFDYAWNLTSVDGETITVYAIWKPITYTITLHYSEDDEEHVAIIENVVYGETSTLPAFSNLEWPENEGYEFAGWYYMNGEDKIEIRCEYNYAATVSNLTTEQGANVDLYILWANGRVKINVTILKQKLDDTYDEDLEDEENYIIVDKEVTYWTGWRVDSRDIYNLLMQNEIYADYINFEGFVLDEDNLEVIESLGVGQSIRVYMKRQTFSVTINISEHIENVTLTAEHDAIFLEEESNTEQAIYIVKYGDKVTLSLKAKAGYINERFVFVADIEFVDNSFTMVAYNLTIDAEADPNPKMTYTVEIYIEDPNTHEFAEPIRGTGTGETDSEITREMVQTVIDETLDSMEGLEEPYIILDDGTTIHGDGSTTIRVEIRRIALDVEVVIESTMTEAFYSNSTSRAYSYGALVELTFVLYEGYSLNSTVSFEEGDFGFIFTFAEDGIFTKPDLSDIHVITSTDDETGYEKYVVFFTMTSVSVSIKVNAKAEETKFVVHRVFETDKFDGTYETLESVADVEKYKQTGKVITDDDIGLNEVDIPEGYVLQSVSSRNEEQRVSGDGNTVVTIYYNRDYIDLFVRVDGAYEGVVEQSIKVVCDGTNATQTADNHWRIKFGKRITISLELEIGYEFAGWTYTLNDAEIKVEELSFETNMPSEELIITAEIVAKADTKYLVEYFGQMLELTDDGQFVYQQIGEDVQLEGETNHYFTREDVVEMIANIKGNLKGQFSEQEVENLLLGYNLDDFDFKFLLKIGEELHDISSVPVIHADGTTIVQIYLRLKVLTVEIETLSEYEGFVISVSGNGSYLYGDEVEVSAELLQGYDFAGWYIDGTLQSDANPYIFKITESKVFTFELKEGVNTYYVVHYDQQLDGKYVERLRETLSGPTNIEIDITELQKAQTGYEFNHAGSDSYTIVAGSEFTVVELYYNLKTVQFRAVYDRNSGITDVTVLPTDVENSSLMLLETGDNYYLYSVKFSETIRLQATTAIGHSLESWYLNDTQLSGSAGREYPYDVRVDTNFTLKAVGKKTVVVIVLNANGGRGGVVTIEAEYGQSVPLGPNTFQSSGTFLGWSFAANGGVAFFNLENVTIDDNFIELFTLSENGERRLVLYAVWKPAPVSYWWIWLLVIIPIVLILTVVVIYFVRRNRDKKNRYLSKQ